MDVGTEYLGLVVDHGCRVGWLAWAGWDLPASYDTDYDAEDGAYLFGELLRAGMVIEMQYQPGKGELLLLPCEDEDFSRLSMLTDWVTISVGREIDRGAELVAEQVASRFPVHPVPSLLKRGTSGRRVTSV